MLVHDSATIHLVHCVAEADMTAVFVAGRVFAFTLDRKTFDGVDWRKHINRQELNWTPTTLSEDLVAGIQGFMKAAKLTFGRLDFLLADDVAYFLEINPNGQWAWLDLEGKEGVFDAVIEELTKGWT